MLDRMFNYENPVWQFMSKVADLLILNIMAIVFSLPIFTIGASWTALYYTLIKVARKEETYVWREFWSSFKSNFKQATAIWGICFAFLAVLSVDIYMWFCKPEFLPKPFKVTTIVVLLIVLTVTIYVFPILSHFDNTVKKTLTNAMIVSLINLPYTILFIVLIFAPIVAVAFFPQLMMVWVMFGISFPAYLSSFAWSRLFKKLEPPTEVEEEEDDEERIFSDELREEIPKEPEEEEQKE